MLIFISLMLSILNGYLYYLDGKPMSLFACGFALAGAIALAVRQWEKGEY